MTTAFQIITEEFATDLDAIQEMVAASFGVGSSTKLRLAAANSATLLLAATFEEFIREMAREFARHVVANTATFEKLPQSLAAQAWKRTMEGLARIKLFPEHKVGMVSPFVNAQTKFSLIYEFCRGDLTKDIYRDLIHNENNMKTVELNGLFKLSGLNDVCKKISHVPAMMEIVGESEAGMTHGKTIKALDDFFDRRNSIAHALNRGQSGGPEQLLSEIIFLRTFGFGLSEILGTWNVPIQASNDQLDVGTLASG